MGLPIISIVLILLLGSLIQSTIGFGFGLIVTPLLVSSGLNLSEAVALVTVATGIQSFLSARQLRQHIPWQDLKLAVVIRYLFIPFGVLLLIYVDSLDPERVKQIVGIVMLIGIGVRLLARGQRQRQLPTWVTISTFSISGILQGAVAMGGPPVILWMTTRDFTAKQARAFTLTLFCLGAPVTLFVLVLLSDAVTLSTLLIPILLIPILFLGTSIGVRVGNNFSKPTLNWVALAVLMIIALQVIL